MARRRPAGVYGLMKWGGLATRSELAGESVGRGRWAGKRTARGGQRRVNKLSSVVCWCRKLTGSEFETKDKQRKPPSSSRRRVQMSSPVRLAAPPTPCMAPDSAPAARVSLARPAKPAPAPPSAPSCPPPLRSSAPAGPLPLPRFALSGPRNDLFGHWGSYACSVIITWVCRLLIGCAGQPVSVGYTRE